jgi:hypothetical protein
MQTDDKCHTTILNIDTKFQLSQEQEINIIKRHCSSLGYDVQSTLKMEASYFFETLGNIYETAIKGKVFPSTGLGGP